MKQLAFLLVTLGIVVQHTTAQVATDTIPGFALSFNGVDIYGSIERQISDDFTIEFWVKTTQPGGTGTHWWSGQGLIDGEMAGVTTDFGTALLGSKVAFGVGNPDVSVISTTDINDDQWHHVAATRNISTGTIELYVDGNLEENAAANMVPLLAPDSLHIGSLQISTNFFNGQMDEIRIWNTVRTAAEIRENMHRTLTGTEAGLVNYYQLNTGSGSTATDGVSSNDATLSNSPSWVASTVAVGRGNVSSITGFTGGTAMLGNVNLTTTNTFDSAVDIYAHEIPLLPNILPTPEPDFQGERYWIVNTYGDGGVFSTNVTFTYPAGELTETHKDSVTLFKRPNGSDGQWITVAEEASSLTATTVTFDDITSFSQLAVGSLDKSIVIESTIPMKNETNVSRSSNITITFSENIDAATVNNSTIIIRGEQTGLIPGVFSGGGTDVITFDPDSDFKAGETLLVTIATIGIEGATDGAVMSAPYSFVFTAAVDPGPETPPMLVERIITTSAFIAQSVYAADVDGDGDIDVLSASENDDKIAWYENDGSQNFTERIVSTLANGANNVYAADVDSDGDLDILSASGLDDKIAWYENDGSQNFTERIVSTLANGANNVYAADVDGDGNMDILSASNIDDKIAWYENDGSQNFTEHSVSDSADFAKSVYAADVDSDGNMDILSASGIDNKIAWYENDGSQNFTEHSVSDSADFAKSVYTADVDGDEDIDILSVSDSDDGSIAWYENDGSQSFTEHSVSANAVVETRMYPADMDGDGDTDILSASFSDDKIAWYENDGSQNFTERIVSTNADRASSVYAADVDGDGDLDILSASVLDNKIAWYENTSITVNTAGRSVLFSATNHHIQIPHKPLFNLSANFTLEAWIKADAFTTNWQAILTKGNGTWRVHRHSNTKTIGFSTSGIVDGSNSVDLQGATNVNDGQWHHVAAVYTGSDKRLYIDGVLDASVPVTGTLAANSDPVRIGHNSGIAGSSWNGNIDEVRIWHEARTEDEIRRNMFQALNGDETNLAGYWKLDEEEDIIAFDQTSNQFNGTLTNGPVRSTDTHPYGTFITGDEGWRMMSAPTNGVSYGTLLEDLWTQGFTGADANDPGDAPNVFRWLEGDGTQDTTARGWQSLNDASVVPDPGEAFIVWVYDDVDFDGTPDGFPKTLQVENAQNDGTVTPTLSLTKQGGSYEAARDGWNLVGNPYGATIDWEAATGWTKTNIDDVFYLWSDSAGGGNGAYLSRSSGGGTLPNGLIAPWQGFWVKANNTGAPALELTDEVRSAGGIFLKERPVPQIQFKIDGNKRQSKAVVMLHEQAEANKDPLDAWKLQSLSADYLSLYTTTLEGHALDINALPLEIEQPLELTMNFEGSDLGGQYTLSWNPKELPEAWPQGAVMLTDLHTDRVIDIGEAGEYTFEVQPAQAKRSGVQPPPSHSNKSGLAQASTLEPPRHGPIPTVLKAKAKNPRFLLTIDPVGSPHRLAGIPQQVELAQNYPNPFNPETIIRYGVPEQSTVQLTIFDILGRKVVTLLNEEKTAGRYQVNFNASRFASGLYIYRLRVGGSVLTKKMMLIK